MKAHKLTHHGLALALLLTSAAAPALAFGDPQGARGTVSELEINHTTTDNYLQYHGRVVVLTGKVKAEYKWGGTACNSRMLNDHLVTMLQRALESGTPIVPRYHAGQGQSLCLVGFTLS